MNPLSRSRRQFLENAALGFRRKQKTNDAANREDNPEHHEHVIDAVASDYPSDQQGSNGRCDTQPCASEARTNSPQTGRIELRRIEIEREGNGLDNGVTRRGKD